MKISINSHNQLEKAQKSGGASKSQDKGNEAELKIETEKAKCEKVKKENKRRIHQKHRGRCRK